MYPDGEPTLMGIEFFEKALKLEKKYAKGKPVRNTLQTNGTPLDDDWCRFLKKNDFLVGLSLDGPEELHDRSCRSTTTRNFPHTLSRKHRSLFKERRGGS